MFEVPQGVPEIHVSEHPQSLKWRFFPALPNRVVPLLRCGFCQTTRAWGYDQQCLSRLVSLFLFINLCIREGLGEAYDGDIAFASSLEMFGGGHNDPISVAFGGQWCNSYFGIYIKIYLFLLIL
jgi:hypothetical protein